MRKAKKFILNALVLTVASLILRSIGVSFTVYISDKIGAEGMGVFQLIMTVYMFAVTIATSGAGIASTRLVAEEFAVNSPGSAFAAVKRCVYYSLFFSIFTAAILCINADFISETWLRGKASANIVYALAVSLPPLSVSCVLGGYFTAVRRIIKSVSAQFLQQGIRITVTVYGLILLLPKGTDYTYLALVMGGLVSEFLSCLYMFILYLFDKKRYGYNLPVKKTLTRRMLGISVPIALSSYIRSALNTFKHLMIPIGLEKSGISRDIAISKYGMIHGMVMPVLMFPSALLSAFSSLLIPEIAEHYVRKNNKRISFIISRIFKVTLIFSVCISGILLAYADELSLAIYKSLDTALFIRVFAPLIVIMYFDEIVDAILKGINEQVSVVGINIFDTASSILLLYTLLPLYGTTGYIIVIFISEIINGFLSIRRLVKTTCFELKIFRWFVIPVIVMAIAVVITKILGLSNLFLCILLTIIVYLIILFIIGGITHKDFTV